MKMLAIALAVTAMLASSRTAAAQIDEASAALYAGDPDRALKLVSARLKEQPGDAAALIVAARAHLARGEHSVAYERLRTALIGHPRNADVLYYLAIVSSELATREFDRLYKLAPGGARVHQLMAQAFKVQGKSGEAAAEYELALAANPNLLEALIDLAAIRREESDCERATALYRRAEAVRTTYESAYGLGVCLAARDDHKGAVDKLREALNHDGSSPSAHFALGSSLLQLNDTAGALRALERAVALEPRMRQGHYLLGRVYRTMGLVERSKQAFARADELARAERAADEKGLQKPPQ